MHREINRDFFKVWSGDMAYVLGFMFADGNIIKNNRGGYYFAIYTADEELLIRMRTSMGSSHKISFKMGKLGGCYSIQIGSKEMFNDLGKVGLTPNKSKRMILPEVPKKYLGDFVRGYFDGDGHVWVGQINKNREKTQMTILTGFTSGSLNFLISLKNILKSAGIRGGCIYKCKTGEYGRLSFSVFDSLRLYEIMYNRPHTLYLDRKKMVFDKYRVLTKRCGCSSTVEHSPVDWQLLA